jgi:hypothetical protein
MGHQIGEKANAKIALVYIRSATRNRDQIQEQKAHCLTICEQSGWSSELFEETKGSGLSLDRREWLKVEARLSDPDVVALVVNDLSRVTRRSDEFLTSLKDRLKQAHIQLILASSDHRG